MDFKVDAEEVYADTEKEAEFRQEVRNFLDKELTPDLCQKVREQPWGQVELLRDFHGKLGAKGWLVPPAPIWPKEYGGVERSPAESRILKEELASRLGQGWDRLGPASEFGGIQGPIIMRYGSEELKREFLPKIARGEYHFALGYTEPNAGTDLASLEMRAVPDGDDYIVNGQKMFSTGAHCATHHWLAVRTDVNVPKHQGISLLIVDLSSPGITIRPLVTMTGEETHEVFYDNVRVPRRNLVGEENKGWDYIREAVSLERALLAYLVDTQGTVDELIRYAKETERNGRPLTEDPIVRQSLAQLAIEVSISRLFGYRITWLMNKGVIPHVETSIRKVWNTELDQQVANAGMQILGLYCQLEPGSKWAPLKGWIELLYRTAVCGTFAAGSTEVLRSLIATRGMGLPREPKLSTERS